MPVLSIIACDMLEDELAYVLSKDSELEQLILVEKMECFGLRDVPFFRQDSYFLRHMRAFACKHCKRF